MGRVKYSAASDVAPVKASGKSAACSQLSCEMPEFGGSKPVQAAPTPPGMGKTCKNGKHKHCCTMESDKIRFVEEKPKYKISDTP